MFQNISKNDDNNILLNEIGKEILGSDLFHKNNYIHHDFFLYFLKSIITDMPGNVYWKNKNSIYIGCNNNIAKIANLSSRFEIIGKDDFYFEKKLNWPKGTAIRFRQNDALVIKSKKTKIFEDIFIQSNGKRVVMLTTKKPVFDENKNVIGILGISVDITKRKDLENELKTAKQNLEATNQSLTVMTGSIVHELRTPLAVVGISTSNLKRNLSELSDACKCSHENNFPIPESILSKFSKLERAIQNIQTETRASNMFIDMLLLNLTNPKMAAEKMQPCSIKACIETALARYPFTDEEKQKIIFDSTNDFIFKGDELITTHIIFNLSKNALYYLKAAEKGDITIWLTSDEKENKLHFKDTAKGIPAEFLPHIFDRFYSKTQGGSGIGLAFCKLSMELFGGSMSCKSVEGEYAEFVLSFPLFKGSIPGIPTHIQF